MKKLTIYLIVVALLSVINPVKTDAFVDDIISGVLETSREVSRAVEDEKRNEKREKESAERKIRQQGHSIGINDLYEIVTLNSKAKIKTYYGIFDGNKTYISLYYTNSENTPS